MRVRVYRNLNNGLISIQCVKNRLVVGHCTNIVLSDVEFIVSEKGRQRVLREKRKNVHAFAEGEVVQTTGFRGYKGRAIAPQVVSIAEKATTKISYNPYKAAHFLSETKEKVTKATVCSIDHHDGIFAANILKESIDTHHDADYTGHIPKRSTKRQGMKQS